MKTTINTQAGAFPGTHVPSFAHLDSRSFPHMKEMVMNTKRSLVALALVALVSLMARPAAATVVAGPVVHNDHIYCVLAPSTCTAAEAEAKQLGGHLVTINDAAENDFLLSLGAQDGVKRILWIGLHADPTPTWYSGEPLTFQNWGSNASGSSKCVDLFPAGTMFKAGTWAGYADLSSEFGLPICGVVEIEPIAYAGHLYCVLGQSNCTTAEAEAKAIGGDLVTINNMDENNFVQHTFADANGAGNRDHVKRMVWIGVHADPTPKWFSDQSVTFENWGSNASGSAKCVDMAPAGAMFKAGTWAGYADLSSEFGLPICGVVEIGSGPSISLAPAAPAALHTTIGIDETQTATQTATPAKRLSWGGLKSLYR